MAVALTSFVQPMLVANESNDSVTNEHTTRNKEPLSICRSRCRSRSRSPSASPSSHTRSDSHCDSAFPACDSLSPCTSNTHSPHSSQLPTTNTQLVTTHSHTHSFSDIALDHAEDSETSDSDTSHSASLSLSQCRYCYADIHRSCNVSQCHCSGTLCKDCLVKELKMTYSRKNHPLHCTVCKSEYKVQTEFSFSPRRDCGSLCLRSITHCGLKDEQYLLDSVGGKIGFLLVIVGIMTWIVSTSLLFAFPPNGCPVELYYMVCAFDFAVGISTMWFIVKCRYLSPLLLSGMYFVRFVYLCLGWVPSVNLCRIYEYHQLENAHVAVLAYFVCFSLCASVVICMFGCRDVRRQYGKFRKDNGKLVLHKDAIVIEITDIVGDERDEF